MGEEQQAKQALLALVCSNRYKPLDTPVPTPKPAPRGPGAAGGDEDFYKDCTPVRKESKFIPEAWTRIGEFHFDNPNELRFAIAAFRKVLTFKDSPYYDRALYKLAWSYYRDNRFPEAVREFDNLVKYADARTAAGQKVGSDLRPEAIQYLGVSFAEPDWDGDTLPDADHRPAARDGLLQGPREGAARPRGVPAARRHLLRPDQVRRRHRRLQGAAVEVAVLLRRPARPGPHRPRLREGPQHGGRPPRSARRSAARTPRAATGTSTTGTTRKRSPSRSSWPRTRC